MNLIDRPTLAMADAGAGTQPAKLLTVIEAANYLGISRTTCYQLMDSGRLAYHRVTARSRRIDMADLEAFKAGCRIGPERPGD